jgi:hypothetical protein
VVVLVGAGAWARKGGGQGGSGCADGSGGLCMGVCE